MKRTLSLLVIIFCTYFSSAQIRGNEVRVVVSPNQTDWNYKLSEQCTFTVQVYKAQNLLSDVIIDYELGPEMYPTDVQRGIVLKDGKGTLQSTMKIPGFLFCKVTAYVDGRAYEGAANVGYSPEDIEPISQYPSRFREFWIAQAAEARKIPLKPHMTLLPERCTDKVNVYHVDFQVNREGSRYYGILCIPKKEGKYPALLRVPGAGARPYQGDMHTAEQGAITLEVGIHGIPVTMETSFYDKLMQGALNNYWTFCRDELTQFYYHRVILGVLRAIDLIDELPQYNKEAMGVTGSSQGGALSVIAASLDARITCLASVHPALCDHEASLKKRASGWPHYFYYMGTPTDKQLEVARHYDVVNFARDIKVPGWYSWGYNDNVCTPSSMYAAYNVIKAPKELSLYLETAHFWYQEQWDEWQQWLWKHLKIMQ